MDSLSLYVAILEDTLLFNAANGEQTHYDVFRRAAWGLNPYRVQAPANVNDSVVATVSVSIDPPWQQGHIYAVGIVQEKNGSLLQEVEKP
ncbi:MAG: hypothetical protein EOO46_11020 [Flavobacterium sp.]|nr:MAG: hypothetical protein EOO46_11020 [Flavobacterium sp.]